MKVYQAAVYVFVSLVILFGLPAKVFAETITVTNQIKITATILPAKYVIVDADNKIQQIISNTSEKDVKLSVYQKAVKPENSLTSNDQIESDVAKLLIGKTIKPGVLYDYKTDAVQVKTDMWLSGIFNLKNFSPTVLLYGSQSKQWWPIYEM